MSKIREMIEQDRIMFCDAAVRADAVFKMHVPEFYIRYLRGDRFRAREDAIRYAQKLLMDEYRKQIGKLMDFVRAEISFKDEEGTETERFAFGQWTRL